MTLSWLGEQADQLWYWVLISLFLVLALLETMWPARVANGSVFGRWFTNIGLHAANAVLVMVMAPAILAEAVMHASGVAWHPFMLANGLSGDAGALLAGVLVLDLYAYALHRLQHATFTLWRFHAVHHADVEMDASTTLRHHPFEVVVNSVAGALLFAALGIPVWVFPIYALLGITVSLLQHANWGTPGRIDRALRLVFVTPGLHQIHHSSDARDYYGNYGTVFSVWDRLFGTLRRDPALGHAAMAFGVAPFDGPEHASPKWGLLLPFMLRRERDVSAAGTQPAAMPSKVTRNQPC